MRYLFQVMQRCLYAYQPLVPSRLEQVEELLYNKSIYVSLHLCENYLLFMRVLYKNTYTILAQTWYILEAIFFYFLKKNLGARIVTTFSAFNAAYFIAQIRHDTFYILQCRFFLRLTFLITAPCIVGCEAFSEV